MNLIGLDRWIAGHAEQTPDNARKQVASEREPQKERDETAVRPVAAQPQDQHLAGPDDQERRPELETVGRGQREPDGMEWEPEKPLAQKTERQREDAAETGLEDQIGTRLLRHVE